MKYVIKIHPQLKASRFFLISHVLLFSIEYTWSDDSNCDIYTHITHVSSGIDLLFCLLKKQKPNWYQTNEKNLLRGLLLFDESPHTEFHRIDDAVRCCVFVNVDLCLFTEMARSLNKLQKRRFTFCEFIGKIIAIMSMSMQRCSAFKRWGKCVCESNGLLMM